MAGNSGHWAHETVRVIPDFDNSVASLAVKSSGFPFHMYENDNSELPMLPGFKPHPAVEGLRLVMLRCYTR